MPVLHPQWLIKTIQNIEVRDLTLGGLWAKGGPSLATRNELAQYKNNQGHTENDNDGLAKSAKEVAKH